MKSNKEPKKKISMDDFYSLIEDPKTNNFLLFEQHMEHLCDTNYHKYIKTLEKIGKWADEAREGHGFKQVWKR